MFYGTDKNLGYSNEHYPNDFEDYKGKKQFYKCYLDLKSF